MGALRCSWASLAATTVSLHSDPPILSRFPLSSFRRAALGSSLTSGSRAGAVGFALYSSHSNPRILKSTRGSPYSRRRTSSCQEQDEEGEDGDEDEEEEEGESDPERSLDGEFYDVVEAPGYRNSDIKQLSIYSRTHSRGTSAHERLLRKDQVAQTSVKGRLKSCSSEKHDDASVLQDVVSGSNGIRSQESSSGKITKSKFLKLKDELDFDVRWFPLVEYLSTYGLKESHFISIYERHMPCLHINVASAKERLEYLMSVGVKHRDIRKMLLRQPQILEYTVENNLKVHVAFLASLGIPDSRIGQIITASPSLFSYSVEHSLKPTIRYLVEEVGISKTDVSKVVQLSPQILVQRIDSSWNSRLKFISRELGAPRDSIVKMVRKHPQLLHYSIEDGIQPRIKFLRSIGMRNSEILKVLTSLTQVLSLSLEGNLKPKYLYLVNELRNEVQSLTKYPTYLSLSLEQRIRPRHRFLVSLKKAPNGPFPLSAFVPTDECFCQQWAGTSLDNYLAFRQSLLLNDFAKKYERK